MQASECIRSARARVCTQREAASRPPQVVKCQRTAQQSDRVRKKEARGSGRIFCSAITAERSVCWTLVDPAGLLIRSLSGTINYVNLGIAGKIVRLRSFVRVGDERYARLSV